MPKKIYPTKNLKWDSELKRWRRRDNKRFAKAPKKGIKK